MEHIYTKEQRKRKIDSDITVGV